MDSKDSRWSLREGDKLDCGCEVLRHAWTHEEASDKVYEATISVLSKYGLDNQPVDDQTSFASLGMNTEQVQALWNIFFVGSFKDFTMPQTIRELVSQVETTYGGPLLSCCESHAW